MHESDEVSTESAPAAPPAETLASVPVIALVGRPNTGKSTLFNRLTGSRRALVAKVAGVTRDRNIATGVHDGRRFLVVDTGGFEAEEHEDLSVAVQGQALLAAEEADAVIVVVDGRAGLNPLDVAMVDRLRGLPKPLFLAINKIDTPKQEYLESDFFVLGLEHVYPISAEHSLQVGELMDAVLALLPAAQTESAPPADSVAVAIFGRPNVGKSSLLNRLLGYDRAVVAPIPGTTRDAIDTPVTHDGRSYLLVDTAGVRRRPKVREHLERASVVRALRALERAQVGVLVIDAAEGMTEQDARVGSYAWERGRGMVLVVNKWDAVVREERDRKAFAADIDSRYPSFGVVPKVFLSALTGRGVDQLWGVVARVSENHRRNLQTAQLNQVLTRAVAQQAPPAVRGRRPRFYYVTQTARSPTTLTVFCSYQDRITAAYERYLSNQLRHSFALEGVPVRWRFSARERSPNRKTQTSQKGHKRP
jgi:GTP-binding protein